MIRLITKALLALVLFIPVAGEAQEAFEGCQLQKRPDDRTDGRFIFKPVGNHFPGNAVIVVPRCYYDGSDVGSPVKVELYTEDGATRIERARLKTTGNCAYHPECFFASSYLTRRNGKYYKRRFGSIRIRITPTAKASELRCNYCSYYEVKKPSQRAAFTAPVIVKISR